LESPGILYYLSLQAGLKPLERYPHSTDIYTDETRFTPLGSDATVVYGYKDFRFVNTLSQRILSQRICFRLSITPDRLIAQLCTPAPVPLYHIEFRPRKLADYTEVETFRRPIEALVPSSPPKSITISQYRQSS
jgi:vancomycin resistance protein VanW